MKVLVILLWGVDKGYNLEVTKVFGRPSGINSSKKRSVEFTVGVFQQVQDIEFPWTFALDGSVFVMPGCWALQKSRAAQGEIPSHLWPAAVLAVLVIPWGLYPSFWGWAQQHLVILLVPEPCGATWMLLDS